MGKTIKNIMLNLIGYHLTVILIYVKQWERNVVLGQAGIYGEEGNGFPKNDSREAM